MAFGYLQRAAQEGHRKREEKIRFEWAYYVTFELQNGVITRLNTGKRGHEKFKPTLKQKLALIMRILLT